ncbi:MAG: hypothetical protein QT03_C0001G0754 [archaeon GW2011_AR10]|uniref:ATP-binding protein n=3 Tax=Candidatus Iainarchaeum sp. TaxID=3101447 RepID=A0A7J4IXF5_9ARCH|nr:MAG: hypothetical protein QT03_C0001G0754 [archaeon GW2011_AR10]HIH08939.1 ATP-binding protein [Candidatus Diapherotrites archaeon]
MEIFKLSDGPWKKLFEGAFEENEVNIYSNPKSIILVLIFEKESGKTSGVVVEMFKVFFSVGEVEGFVETLPREIILLTKHDEKETLKFLVLGSRPSYIKWEEQQFMAETDTMLKRLKTSSTLIKDVSKAYDLTLQELSEAHESAQKAFFTQPLLVPLLSTSSHETESGIAGIAKGEIIFGLTKKQEQVLEPINLFNKTIIFGGREHDRRHVLKVIAESALLSSIPVVVLDWNNVFKSLNDASKDLDGLKKYKVGIDPIGFPVKILKPVEEIKVDLNCTNAKGLAEVFGIGDNIITKIIVDTLRDNRVSGISELIEKVKATTPGEEPNIYELNKAVRILSLISQRYPGLFEGKNDYANIVAGTGKSIGRAAIIDLSGVDDRVKLLVGHNIFNGLLKQFKGKDKTGKPPVLIVPHAKIFVGAEKASVISAESIIVISELGKIGVGYALEEENALDIAKEVANSTEAKITIIKENDISVQLKGRQSYRVFVRPTLSRAS